ncbi:MAG: SDR family NAD(P)-dependent oxidoreductase, partial [Psychrobacter sp.]|nr:SDR family NAD(P)-dependent oxidoreductase [Psychrobacter sp.]
MVEYQHKSFQELFDLSGKVAIVTGGANGIGKATALRLAQAGADIVIADLKKEDAEEAVQEIEKFGVKGLAVECNILKDDSLVALVDTVIKTFGKINIL